MNQEQDKKNDTSFPVPVKGDDQERRALWDLFLGAAIGTVIGSLAASSTWAEYGPGAFSGLGLLIIIFLPIFLVAGLFSGIVVAGLAYRFGNVKSMFVPGLIGGFLGPLMCWILRDYILGFAI